MQLSLIL